MAGQENGSEGIRMSSARYTIGKLVDKLKQTYGMDDLTKSTPEHYVAEGLLYPEKKGAYSYYAESDVTEVLKIKFMVKVLGISLEQIRKIEGVVQTNHVYDKKLHKPVYAKKEKRNPDLFWELLMNPASRTYKGQVEIGSLSRNEEINHMLVQYFAELKHDHDERWYDKVDWHSLYERCRSFVPQQNKVLAEEKLEQWIQDVGKKINMEELLAEAAEEIRDEVYDSVVEEIMDRFELDDFDEDEADPEILEHFHHEMEEWIADYESEKVMEKLEAFMDAEINNERLKIEGTYDWVGAVMRKKLIDELMDCYHKKRPGYSEKWNEMYEAERHILDPEDMELLSILFYGKILIPLFMYNNRDERIQPYIEEYYSQLKQLNKRLLQTYSEHMKICVSLHCIPDSEQSVLKEAAEYGIPIIYGMK